MYSSFQDHWGGKRLQAKQFPLQLDNPGDLLRRDIGLLRRTQETTQCRKFIIFPSLRIYVKSILRILEVQDWHIIRHLVALNFDNWELRRTRETTQCWKFMIFLSFKIWISDFREIIFGGILEVQNWPFSHIQRLWNLFLMDSYTFWRLKRTKSIKFRPPKIAKMPVLELLDTSKLNSRKNWETEKSLNFHTVNHYCNMFTFTAIKSKQKIKIFEWFAGSPSASCRQFLTNFSTWTHVPDFYQDHSVEI